MLAGKEFQLAVALLLWQLASPCLLVHFSCVCIPFSPPSIVRCTVLCHNTASHTVCMHLRACVTYYYPCCLTIPSLLSSMFYIVGRWETILQSMHRCDGVSTKVYAIRVTLILRARSTHGWQLVLCRALFGPSFFFTIQIRFISQSTQAILYCISIP
jgi:hypothetical protein